jgi:hypothetical protein
MNKHKVSEATTILVRQRHPAKPGKLAKPVAQPAGRITAPLSV